MHLPRLYPILDAEVLERRGISISRFATELAAAGVELLQYRDKTAAPQTILANAAVIRAAAPGVTLILNDRPDLAALAGWDGTHVGQTDLHPNDVRRILGAGKIVGVSTHNRAEFEAAIETGADYVAIGPIYETATKLNPEPTTGLTFLRDVRKLTSKPIVAIGGITIHTARQVLDAGADSVAVISALVPATPEESASPQVEAFLEALTGNG